MLLIIPEVPAARSGAREAQTTTEIRLFSVPLCNFDLFNLMELHYEMHRDGAKPKKLIKKS